MHYYKVGSLKNREMRKSFASDNTNKVGMRIFMFHVAFQGSFMFSMFTYMYMDEKLFITLFLYVVDGSTTANSIAGKVLWKDLKNTSIPLALCFLPTQSDYSNKNGQIQWVSGG